MNITIQELRPLFMHMHTREGCSLDPQITLKERTTIGAGAANKRYPI